MGAPLGLALLSSLCNGFILHKAVFGHLSLSRLLSSDCHCSGIALLSLVPPELILGKSSPCFGLSHMPILQPRSGGTELQLPLESPIYRIGRNSFSKRKSVGKGKLPGRQIDGQYVKQKLLKSHLPGPLCTLGGF